LGLAGSLAGSSSLLPALPPTSFASAASLPPPSPSAAAESSPSVASLVGVSGAVALVVRSHVHVVRRSSFWWTVKQQPNQQAL